MAKRFSSWFSMIFGVFGLVACLVTVAATWIVRAKMVQVTDQVSVAVGDSIAAAQQNLTRIGDRVESMRLTAEEIQATAQTWTESELREQLLSELALEEKANRLSKGMSKADQWLEAAESLLLLVQRGLEFGTALGVSIPKDATGTLMAQVATTRNELAELNEPVQRLQEQIVRSDDNEGEEKRVELILRPITRLVVTFGSVNSRIGVMNERLDEIDTSMQQARDTANRWTLWGAAGVTLLILWMAAGQAALAYLGWTAVRASPAA